VGPRACLDIVEKEQFLYLGHFVMMYRRKTKTREVSPDICDILLYIISQNDMQ
jgi:hypothetical protein